MGKRSHFNGPKHRGKHTSIIPIAEDLVREARRLPQVTGIAPGFIQNVRSKKPRIEYRKIAVGLEVRALGNNSMQTLILHTDSPLEVEGLLRSRLE